MKSLIAAFIFWTPIALYSQLPAKAEDISPLLVGEIVPNATLQTMDSKTIGLSSILRTKKTILIFYRGGWCPYCNLHLSEVGRIEKDLLALGYQVIAVSPDAPEKLKPSMDKMEISYTLLSDRSGELTKATGLAFKAPANYDKFLADSQGKNAELFLPVPSLFILNEKSEILFEYINPNFKNRINGYLLLAAARVFAVNK